MFRLSAVVVVAVVATGCASTTVINSSPPGARVYIDGAELGVTPYSYSDSVNATTRHQLTLKKEGYRDLSTQIAADRWDTGKVVLSVIFCLPALFVSTEYPPGYNYTLEPAYPGGPQPYPQQYPYPYPPPQSAPPPQQNYPQQPQSYPPAPNYPPPPPSS